MKSIGIVNYQFSDRNYGAVLQAAALHWVIGNKLGYKSEHINYIPVTIKLSLIGHLKYKIGNVLRSLKLKKEIIRYSDFKNKNVFEDFRIKYLPRSNDVYSSLDELKSSSFDYTHVVVGSDQVWRPSYTENSTLVYFLDFLPSNVKKISYAASFGNDSWELDIDTLEHKNVVKALNQFNSISVREDSGVNICKNIFDKDVMHVLDPTLLAGKEFFEDIINDSIESESESESEIVYYKLEIDGEFTSFISSLENKTGYKSENIYYNKVNNNYYYYSVDEWLYKIKKSKIIITDSFHCVCFSILFNKQFIYYPNDNRGLSRLNSLLGLLGLENRIYKADIKNHFRSIDYEIVNSRLDKLRESSMNFLIEGLR
ncbi:polysaccharide pyruvyl transferase family protein [Photobacterium phosphoreum]|uniref:polysaccharide pyruvyl transferase family protein n=1 Tax=Photobacterium phosphoreum TaxID=659 RepID=UPI0039AF7C60